MLRKYLSFLLAFILIVGMGLVAAGCGTSNDDQKSGSNGDTTNGSENTTENTATEEPVKKFIVGTDAAYAPFESVNESGEIVGLDIDFVKALAEAGGFEVEFRNTGWDPLFEAVKNGEVDFGVSAITITDDRKKTFDFTDPYFVANQLILVPENSTVTKFEDLKDKNVGVQNGTTGHEVVKGLLGETSTQIKAFESTPLAIQDMLIGGVDAVVADNAVVLEFIKQNPDAKLKSIEDDTFEKEYYGLMVKKGNTELLNTLNDALKKLKESGKLKEIFGQELE